MKQHYEVWVEIDRRVWNGTVFRLRSRYRWYWTAWLAAHQWIAWYPTHTAWIERVMKFRVSYTVNLSAEQTKRALEIAGNSFCGNTPREILKNYFQSRGNERCLFEINDSLMINPNKYDPYSE